MGGPSYPRPCGGRSSSGRDDRRVELGGGDVDAGASTEETQARDLVRLTRRWVNDHGFALLMDTHTRKRIEGQSSFRLDDLFGSSLFARDPEVVSRR